MKKSLQIETNIKTINRLLEDLKSGELQIPPFQRDFVWERDNIKDLFDSIKSSYPIGSIILWKPASEMEWKNKSKIGSYSLSNYRKDGTYVLDGYQRLSSLFGCLTNPEKMEMEVNEKERNAYYGLYYDLEDESFVYLRAGAKPLIYQIPVYILMSSSDFRQYSRKNIEPYADPDKIDLYLDRADNLSRRLLEYRIACIEITNANIEEAVDIFSRINSKGTDISFDWMVNALSYDKGNFRFADIIDELQESLEEYNFDKIGRNTLFRCVQSAFGKLYIDQKEIEKLAKRSDFADVTRQIIPHIKAAVSFLYENLNVVEYKLLPYNMQLIFLMEFFRQLNNPTDRQLEDMKEWFWITTYSNYFTINNLSNQRKSYDHFLRYLKGIEDKPLYNDNTQIPYKALSFPRTISMGSVRTKALVLFELNHYSGNGKSIGKGLCQIKLIRKNGLAPANVLLLDDAFRTNAKKILDLRVPSLWDEDIKDMDKLFLSQELLQYRENSKDEVFVQERTKFIMDAECEFVKKLGIVYSD